MAGIDTIPDALRDLGYECQSIYDVYGLQQAQYVDDPDWIRRCAVEQWIAITRDYLRLWRHVICEDHVRIFRVARSAETEDEQVEYVRMNIGKIVQRARHRGPYVYRVDPKDVKLYFPTAEVPCP